MLSVFNTSTIQSLTEPSQQAALKSGATAQAWAATVSELVGGKAGGKSPTAIGNGTDAKKVDEAIERATEYLAKLGI